MTDTAPIEQATTLMLDGPLTVRHAPQIHARLREALRQGSVAIDCRAADEVDVSFIQLVLAARRSAAATGRTLRLAHPADATLLDRLRQAGMVRSGDEDPAADQDFWLNRETADGQDHPHGG
jgi:ABC-type transporter Mla MlaB component